MSGPRDGWKVTAGRNVAHWFRVGDAPLDNSNWPVYPLCGNAGNPCVWSEASLADLGLTWRMCRVCYRLLPAHLERVAISETVDALIRESGCVPPLGASP